MWCLQMQTQAKQRTDCMYALCISDPDTTVQNRKEKQH